MPLFIAFSILFQRISGVLDLISFHSFVSGFTPKTYTIFYDNIKIEKRVLLEDASFKLSPRCSAGWTQHKQENI
jgi:hypothetical protein